MKVRIKCDIDLPHPQCLYEGKEGKAEKIDGSQYIRVRFPKGIAESGADETMGLNFFAEEIEGVEE